MIQQYVIKRVGQNYVNNIKKLILQTRRLLLGFYPDYKKLIGKEIVMT